MFPLRLGRQAISTIKFRADKSENSRSRTHLKNHKNLNDFLMLPVCWLSYEIPPHSIFQLKLYHSMHIQDDFPIIFFICSNWESSWDQTAKEKLLTRRRWDDEFFLSLCCSSERVKFFLLVFWHSSENCSIKISSQLIRKVELVAKWCRKMRNCGKVENFTFHMKKVAIFVS